MTPLQPPDDGGSNASCAVATADAGGECSVPLAGDGGIDNRRSRLDRSGSLSRRRPSSVPPSCSSSVSSAGLVDGDCSDQGIDHDFRNGQDAEAASLYQPPSPHANATSKAHGYNNGGHERFRLGEFDGALRLYARALKWAKRAEATSSEETVGAVGCQGTEVSGGDATATHQRRQDACLLVAMTLVNVGLVHLSRNEPRRAESCYRDAARRLRSPPLSLPPDHSDIARIERKLRVVREVERRLDKVAVLHGRGKRSEMTGSYDAALASYEESLSILIESVGNVHPVVGATLHRIGVMHWKRGRYEAALGALSDALRVTTLCYGEDNLHATSSAVAASTASRTCPRDENDGHGDDVDDGCCPVDAAETLSSIGMVHLARGDYAASLRFYKVALRVRREALGRRHPDVARILIRIGMVLDEEGRHGKAMRLFRDGLSMQREALSAALSAEKERGRNQVSTADSAGDSQTETTATVALRVDVAATLNSMGVALEKCSDCDKALVCYEEALDIYRAALGTTDDHVDVAVTLNNIGQVHRRRGDHGKAMESYRTALGMMKNVLGDEHRNVAATMHNIAGIHAVSGEHDEALALYRKVLELQRAALGDDHADVAVTLDSMGDAYERRGDAVASSSTGFVPADDQEASERASYRRETYHKAARLYRKALHVRRNALGSDHCYVALTLHKMGTFYFRKGDNLSEARRRFEEAVRIYRLHGMSDDEPRVADALDCVSQVELRERDRIDSNCPSAYSSTSSRLTYGTGSQVTLCTRGSSDEESRR